MRYAIVLVRAVPWEVSFPSTVVTSCGVVCWGSCHPTVCPSWWSSPGLERRRGPGPWQVHRYSLIVIGRWGIRRIVLWMIGSSGLWVLPLVMQVEWLWEGSLGVVPPPALVARLLCIGFFSQDSLNDLLGLSDLYCLVLELEVGQGNWYSHYFDQDLSI